MFTMVKKHNKFHLAETIEILKNIDSCVRTQVAARLSLPVYTLDTTIKTRACIKKVEYIRVFPSQKA